MFPKFEQLEPSTFQQQAFSSFLEAVDVPNSSVAELLLDAAQESTSSEFLVAEETQGSTSVVDVTDTFHREACEPFVTAVDVPAQSVMEEIGNAAKLDHWAYDIENAGQLGRLPITAFFG